MDLISLTVGLPFAPLRGLLAIAKVIQEEADEELYSPAAARRQLEAIEEELRTEQVSDEAATKRQQQVVDRLLRG
jgi:hypothetical protein